jgi:hypothetical protein
MLRMHEMHACKTARMALPVWDEAVCTRQQYVRAQCSSRAIQLGEHESIIDIAQRRSQLHCLCDAFKKDILQDFEVIWHDMSVNYP